MLGTLYVWTEQIGACISGYTQHRPAVSNVTPTSCDLFCVRQKCVFTMHSINNDNNNNTKIYNVHIVTHYA